MERAIDYALEHGVIVVVAAGNEGGAGLSHPGAYARTISVAAYGFTDQFEDCTTDVPRIETWWRICDVADPTDVGEFFLADFSSRPLAGQQIDLAGPGDNVLGACKITNGPLGWFFLSGTSMATPHVTGVVALMLEKYPALSHAYVHRSWRTQDAGAGLLDAVAALNATP